MLEYITAAKDLGQALCDHLKATEGWDCSFHLGDYEAGIETITIEAGCCCFDEATRAELAILNAFAGKLNTPCVTVKSANHKFDCDIHNKRKAV